jgi:uncharacterized protein YcbX
VRRKAAVQARYGRIVPLTLTALNRFPVKSCRGEPLQEATVAREGLLGDRRWMVVDEDGAAVTSREVHRLLLVHPRFVPGGIELAAPDLPTLEVATPADSRQVPVRVHSDPLSAALADDAAHAWFSKLIGRPARLVYLDDPSRRRTNPERTRPDDRVSLADAYPLLLTSEDSLTALNDWIAEGPRADEGPLPMQRFRPNVVVRGAAPWAEDDWRRIRIGAAEFRLVKGCDRCVMTTLDPDTAVGGKEPIATLARYRRWNGKTWFGVNLVPDTPGRDIRVGDEVAVLDAAEPGAGPLR